MSRFIHYYTECRYTECRYAECRGASLIPIPAPLGGEMTRAKYATSEKKAVLGLLITFTTAAVMSDSVFSPRSSLCQIWLTFYDRRLQLGNCDIWSVANYWIYYESNIYKQWPNTEFFSPINYSFLKWICVQGLDK